MRSFGQDGSFLHPFPITTALELGRGNALFVPELGREIHAGEELMPLPVTADGAAIGELAFAGFGITAPEQGGYDDYGGIDVRGRIVVAVRHEPRPPGISSWPSAGARHAELGAKVRQAARHGAVGFLLVNRPESPTEAAPPLDAPIVFPDAGIPAAHVRYGLIAAMLAARGIDLTEEIARIDASSCPRSVLLDGAPLHMRCQLGRTRVTSENVIGWIGPEDAREAVVLGAHYDHLGRGGPGSRAYAVRRVHHGADDNASGTAAVLAAARALAAAPEMLERRVIFALFSGEEEGLWGSSHYVAHAPFPIERTAAMVNLDMVGRMKGGRLMLGGMGTADEWARLAPEAATDLDLRLMQVSGSAGPSDHAPFLEAGVPVLFLFTGLHDDYHRPTDRAESVNVGGLRRVALFTERLVRLLASPGPRLLFRAPIAAATDDAILAEMGLRVRSASRP